VSSVKFTCMKSLHAVLHKQTAYADTLHLPRGHEATRPATEENNEQHFYLSAAGATNY
jgi:hypothetical protein